MHTIGLPPDRGAGSLRKRAAVLVAVATTLILGGCGGDDSDGREAGGGASDGTATTSIRVSYPPTIEAAPLFIARNEGFFEDVGLSVETVPVESAAAQLPALTSGTVQFAQSTPLTALTAVGEGLPVRVVVGGGRSGDGAGDLTGVAVGASSDAQSLEDLEGGTVSVIVLKSGAEYAIRDLFELNGLDISSVELVEVPFAEIPAALASDRVDASFIAEPFKTIVESEGGRTISAGLSAIAGRSIEESSWITTADYLEEAPDVVERFVEAMYRANAFANDNLETVRAVLREETEIPPEVIADVAIPQFPDAIDTEAYADVYLPQLTRYSPTPQEPDLDEVLITEVTSR
jgi:NitT/TauT family transport system substrate-binding protein